MIIEALKCNHCGRIALAVEDTRVTDHKCAGSWTVKAIAGVRFTKSGMQHEDLTAKLDESARRGGAATKAFEAAMRGWRRKP